MLHNFNSCSMKYLSVFLLIILAQWVTAQQSEQLETTMADAIKWEKNSKKSNNESRIIDVNDYQWMVPENQERAKMPFFKSNFNPKDLGFYLSGDLELMLIWRTIKNVGVSHYEIERFTKDQRFESLQAVGSGNGLQPIESYIFNDKSPIKGICNYRIVQVMQTGDRKFSPILSLKYDRPDENVVLISTLETNSIEVVVSKIEKPISIFFFDEYDNILSQEVIRKNGRIRTFGWPKGVVRYDILGKGIEAKGFLIID